MDIGDQVRAAHARRFRFLQLLWQAEQSGQQLVSVLDLVGELGIDANDWTSVQGITSPLQADGLIDGVETAETGLVRVRLTAKGRSHVEGASAGGHTSASPASVGDITIDGTNINVQVSQHSSGEQSAITYNAFDLRKIVEWANDVENRVKAHHMPEEDRREAERQAVALREEASKPEPDQSKVRAIGKGLLRILRSGSASLASKGLVEAGSRLLEG